METVTAKCASRDTLSRSVGQLELDIQRIQCKNHQKTSSYRRNSVPYKEIRIKESIGDLRTFNRKFISGRSCACAVKIWLEIALNAVRLPKFEPVIVVDEKDHGKRFTATFRTGVILRMRRELRGL